MNKLTRDEIKEYQMHGNTMCSLIGMEIHFFLFIDTHKPKCSFIFCCAFCDKNYEPVGESKGSGKPDCRRYTMVLHTRQTTALNSEVAPGKEKVGKEKGEMGDKEELIDE